MQTPYNSNKCVALTSSQEEVNHKLQLVLPVEEKEDLNELVNEKTILPRQVSTFSNLNLELYIHQYMIWMQTYFEIYVTDKIILTDFKSHQEHEVSSIFDSQKNVAINCLLPTRVFQDILSLAPKLLTKMKRKNSLVLNIEDYSVLEKLLFCNAV